MRHIQMSVLIIAAFFLVIPVTAALPVHSAASGLPISNLTSSPPIWAFNGSYEVYNGTMKMNGTVSTVNVNLTIENVDFTAGTFTVIATGQGSTQVSQLSQALLPGNQSTFMIPMPFLAISPTLASIIPLGAIAANLTGLSINMTISSVQLITTPAGTFSGYNVSLSTASIHGNALIDAMNGIFATAGISDYSTNTYINLTLVHTNVPPTQFALVNDFNNYLAGNNLYIIGGALTALDAIVIGFVLLKRVHGH